MRAACPAKTMDNRVQLCGNVLDAPVFSHTVGSTRIFKCTLQVPRKSGVCDHIPLLLPEYLAKQVCGGQLGVRGQLRGYLRRTEDGRRLLLRVLVRELFFEPLKDNNRVELCVRLLRPAVYRVTPMGREIADLLLRAQRERGWDLIPAVVWGGCARFVRRLQKDQCLQLEGRIQSRTYMKRNREGWIEERVALELSIGRLLVLG